MARRLGVRHAPTARRKRVWADQEIATDGIAEDTLSTTNLLSGFVTAGGSTQGVTVMRTLIDLSWTFNATATAKDRLTIGLIKGTTTTADVADPVNEPYADWAYIRTIFYGGESGLLTLGLPQASHHDVHSMRKIDEVGETWLFVAFSTAPGSVNTFDLRARVRTLLLLP